MANMGRSNLSRSDMLSSERTSHLRQTKNDTRYMPHKNAFVNSLMKRMSETVIDISCQCGDGSPVLPAPDSMRALILQQVVELSEVIV